VRLIILLAMLAIALPFIISQVAMPYGVAVSLRFLERPTNSVKPKYTIPAESDNPAPLTKESLIGWTQTKRGQLAQDTPCASFHLTYSIYSCSALFSGSQVQPLQI
jgi:hypothetical protein